MRNWILALGIAATACATAGVGADSHPIDRETALSDLRILSADDMDGRGTGTEGAERARAYITGRFEEIGIVPAFEDYQHAFTYQRQGASHDGINLVGLIEGTADSDTVMIVTAHYDHLGNCGGQICNGADDNASGVAALLAVAADFVANPPEHDIYFAALDAEEVGLQGAAALVNDFPVDLDRLALNVNLDMLGYQTENELPAAGAFHYPFLRDRVARAEVVEPVILIQGYDSPEWGPNGDWTFASDHGPFHRAGIPFIYYGVDFHEHYHQPTDEYEVMTLDFFVGATETVLNAVRLFDSELDAIRDERDAARTARPTKPGMGQ
ncbi:MULTISPECIES: M28 family peptidase [Hyphobacterium]|uniref:M28 family peptidase n=1 Tax=Hyphobacterium vulgare TaxID=1736751 RepID=A0ABV7A0M7_9PROT